MQLVRCTEKCTELVAFHRSTSCSDRHRLANSRGR